MLSKLDKSICPVVRVVPKRVFHFKIGGGFKTEVGFHFETMF